MAAPPVLCYTSCCFTLNSHRKDDDMPRSHMKRRKIEKKHRKNIRRLKALARKRRMEAKAAASKAKRK